MIDDGQDMPAHPGRVFVRGEIQAPHEIPGHFPRTAVLDPTLNNLDFVGAAAQQVDNLDRSSVRCCPTCPLRSRAHGNLENSQAGVNGVRVNGVLKGPGSIFRNSSLAPLTLQNIVQRMWKIYTGICRLPIYRPRKGVSHVHCFPSTFTSRTGAFLGVCRVPNPDNSGSFLGPVPLGARR